MTRKILVIGYGNTLRGDDGIGYRVAESLTIVCRDRRVEVQALPLLPPELVLDLADASAALFIDADSQLQPLTWSLDAVSPTAVERSLFMSHLRPSSLLFWTQWMYRRSPQAYLLRIGARYFDFDEQLSVAMTGLLPELTAAAQAIVNEWLSPTAGALDPFPLTDVKNRLRPQRDTSEVSVVQLGPIADCDAEMPRVRL